MGTTFFEIHKLVGTTKIPRLCVKVMLPHSALGSLVMPNAILFSHYRIIALLCCSKLVNICMDCGHETTEALLTDGANGWWCEKWAGCVHEMVMDIGWPCKPPH